MIPNLLVEGVAQAIHEADARQGIHHESHDPGRRDRGLYPPDHVRALFDHGGEGLFDHCLSTTRPSRPPRWSSTGRRARRPSPWTPPPLARMASSGGVRPGGGYSPRAGAPRPPWPWRAAVTDLYRRISPTRIY